jgi:hypothetical protein
MEGKSVARPLPKMPMAKERLREVLFAITTI